MAIDGLNDRDETTGSSRVAIGQEAVAEFCVTASSIAPEFGGGAGGNLNVVTLSGTNRFHGDVNLFAAETSILPYRRQYQPEVALNGPLRRDRTFFAATIEAERESGQEFSEIAGHGISSRINGALARPLFSRAAVPTVGEGFFPTRSASTQASLKLSNRVREAHELTVRYRFRRAAP